MFGLPLISSSQLYLRYFSTLFALPHVQFAASRSCAFSIAMQSRWPDADLSKQADVVEQATARDYAWLACRPLSGVALIDTLPTALQEKKAWQRQRNWQIEAATQCIKQRKRFSLKQNCKFKTGLTNACSGAQ